MDSTAFAGEGELVPFFVSLAEGEVFTIASGDDLGVELQCGVGLFGERELRVVVDAADAYHVDGGPLHAAGRSVEDDMSGHGTWRRTLWVPRTGAALIVEMFWESEGLGGDCTAIGTVIPIAGQ
jgi:hypothetical protein